jgi:hypothetical protein
VTGEVLRHVLDVALSKGFTSRVFPRLRTVRVRLFIHWRRFRNNKFTAVSVKHLFGMSWYVEWCTRNTVRVDECPVVCEGA